MILYYIAVIGLLFLILGIYLLIAQIWQQHNEVGLDYPPTDRSNSQSNDPSNGIKCPCGNDKIWFIECTDCRQPVQKCSKCFPRLLQLQKEGLLPYESSRLSCGCDQKIQQIQQPEPEGQAVQKLLIRELEQEREINAQRYDDHLMPKFVKSKMSSNEMKSKYHDLIVATQQTVVEQVDSKRHPPPPQKLLVTDDPEKINKKSDDNEMDADQERLELMERERIKFEFQKRQFGQLAAQSKHNIGSKESTSFFPALTAGMGSLPKYKKQQDAKMRKQMLALAIKEKQKQIEKMESKVKVPVKPIPVGRKPESDFKEMLENPTAVDVELVVQGMLQDDARQLRRRQEYFLPDSLEMKAQFAQRKFCEKNRVDDAMRRKLQEAERKADHERSQRERLACELKRVRKDMNRNGNLLSTTSMTRNQQGFAALESRNILQRVPFQSTKKDSNLHQQREFKQNAIGTEVKRNNNLLTTCTNTMRKSSAKVPGIPFQPTQKSSTLHHQAEFKQMLGKQHLIEYCKQKTTNNSNGESLPKFKSYEVPETLGTPRNSPKFQKRLPEMTLEAIATGCSFKTSNEMNECKNQQYVPGILGTSGMSPNFRGLPPEMTAMTPETVATGCSYKSYNECNNQQYVPGILETTGSSHNFQGLLPDLTACADTVVTGSPYKISDFASPPTYGGCEMSLISSMDTVVPAMDMAASTGFENSGTSFQIQQVMDDISWKKFADSSKYQDTKRPYYTGTSATISGTTSDRSAKETSDSQQNLFSVIDDKDSSGINADSKVQPSSTKYHVTVSDAVPNDPTSSKCRVTISEVGDEQVQQQVSRVSQETKRGFNVVPRSKIQDATGMDEYNWTKQEEAGNVRYKSEYRRKDLEISPFKCVATKSVFDDVTEEGSPAEC